ncbi:MAG: glutamate--tRNA ligase [Pseudomonadota bacterium]
MSVTTRFAPSPTGFLHIGGARTALFNWLYARHHEGKFLLRIEDTDRERSTEAAVDAIFDGLDWLGLDADAPAVYQSSCRARHVEVVDELLANGKAYRCWCSPDELAAMRDRARAEKRPIRYDGTWRDRDPAEAPVGVDPVIRIRMPQTGETVIDDAVQGRVVVQNAELDDMVLLRADGTPTYMLSVVVDDHDMDVTHVIRGDDHLNNAFRQAQVFEAMGWRLPVFGHLPLIHGADGAKMSKRHGAVGVDAYRDMGFLPEAMRNYLLRLGWSHGDDEIISTAQAIAWFDLDAVGRSAARFDVDKLTALNAHYLRERGDDELVAMLVPRLEALGFAVEPAGESRLRRGMAGLKQRARRLDDLAESAAFYVASRPIPVDAKAAKVLDADAQERLRVYAAALEDTRPAFAEPALEGHARAVAEQLGVGFGKLAQPLRAALTGRGVSPGLFDVMMALGEAEVRARLTDAIARK